LTKISKKKFQLGRTILIPPHSRPKNSAFPEDYSYSMYTHFVEQQNFFNLNIKKILFNKADQKLRDPQKLIFT
jgi:hypothetical protein